MGNDMILDLDNFDFSLIDSDVADNQISTGSVKESSTSWMGGEVDDDNDYDFDNEDTGFEEEAVEVEDDEEVADIDLQSKFDSIDDDAEFSIGGETITKAELEEVVRSRSDISEARDGLNAYISNLSEVEMRVSTYLNASMTETETRLRQVEQMLADPERLTPTEVQKALVAKRDLMARQNQLEENARNVRAAEEERRQQLDLMKIRQTDTELRAKVPGYRGIETLKEVALWAQKEGIDESALRQSMSPALIKALMDAKLYREKVGSKKSIRENAQKRTQAPRSMSSRPTKSPAKTHKAAKAEAMKKFAAGDASAIFDYLED